MNTNNIAAVAALALALSVAAASCGKGPEGGGRGTAFDRSKITFPVEIQTVALRSLIYTVNAVGSVDAFEKVQVTARVAGVVDRVLFAEGNIATVGQVLVEIEPERYVSRSKPAQASFRKSRSLIGRRRGRPQTPDNRHHPERRDSFPEKRSRRGGPECRSQRPTSPRRRRRLIRPS